jgi:6-phospho-beta-glucosidase
MSALGAHLLREWGARFTVRGERDPRTAIAGSRFVFSAIRVGQEEARANDERIALDHGVLGQETTGPGGFAMALRTIPVMLRYAELIGEVEPDALVVNFTNPVGIIAQALCDHSPVRVVGVCDGPIEMKRSVAELLAVPPDRVHADYAGLNHAGWIHRVLVDGVDRLPEVLDRYEELQRLEDSWGLFSPGFVRSIGMLPMEYLYFFYSGDRAVQNILRSGGSRGEQIARLNAPLWLELAERVASDDLEGARAAWERTIEARHQTYFARERGAEVADGVPAEAPPPEEMFKGDGYEGLATAVMVAAVQQRAVPLIVNAPTLSR